MKRLRSAFRTKKDVTEPLAMVIHAHGSWLKSIKEEKFDFFNKLIRQATSQGVTTRIVAAEGTASKFLIEQNHINIVVGGQSNYGKNRLHALPSYIWGFWYLDEVGVHWNSSMRFAKFNPDEVDAAKAEYFFNGVSGYMLRENVSKVGQETRMKNPMQQAAAVIYTQEIENNADRSHFLSTEQIIRTTARACKDELVYVKPHPQHSKTMRKRILDICADYQNINVSEASLHDLTEASRMVVTQNSAAGFEAMMQKRCIITCGKSDFWHATLTPKRESDLKEALKFGPEAMADFPYEKYFYWFLDRNCLEPAKEEFASRAWKRIQEKVFL